MVYKLPVYVPEASASRPGPRRGYGGVSSPAITRIDPRANIPKENWDRMPIRVQQAIQGHQPSIDSLSESERRLVSQYQHDNVVPGVLRTGEQKESESRRDLYTTEQSASAVDLETDSDRGIWGGALGLASGIADVLDTGLNIAAEAGNRSISLLQGEGVTPEGDPAGNILDIFAGAAGAAVGKHNTATANLFANTLNKDIDDLNGWLKWGSLATDVFLDPTTYFLPTSVIGKAGAGIRTANSAAKMDEAVKGVHYLGDAINKGSDATQALIRGDQAYKVNYWQTVTDIHRDSVNQALQMSRSTQRGASSSVDEIFRTKEGFARHLDEALEGADDAAFKQQAGMAKYQHMRQLAKDQGMKWNDLDATLKESLSHQADEAFNNAHIYNAELFLNAMDGQDMFTRAYGIKLNKLGRGVLKGMGMSAAQADTLAITMPWTTGMAMRNGWMTQKISNKMRKVSTSSSYGKGLAAAKRQAESAAYGLFTKSGREYRRAHDAVKGQLTGFKNVNKSQKAKNFTKAQNDKLSRSLATGDTSGFSQAEQDMHDFYRAQLDSMADVEEARGFLALEDEYIENFFPHYYKGNFDRTAAGRVKTRRHTANKARSGPTSRENAWGAAEAEGLTPVNDVDQVMQAHIKEHHDKIGRHNVAKAYAAKYGVRVQVDDNGKIISAADQARVDKVVKNKNYVRETVVTSSEDEWKRNFGDLLWEYDSEVGWKNYQVFMDPDQHATMFRDIMKMNEVKAGREFWHLYRKGYQTIKSNITVWNPGFHIRNFRGDVILNAMNGTFNPKTYVQAARVQWATRAFAPEGAADALKYTFGKGSNKITLTASEISDLYLLRGGSSGYLASELDVLPAGILDYRKGTKKIRDFTEGREEFTRLTNFMHSLDNEMANLAGKSSKLSPEQTINLAADRATARVRKANIDYGDLTPTEKNIRAYAIPFYSWQRKSLPLVIERMATHPWSFYTPYKMQEMFTDVEGPFISDLDFAADFGSSHWSTEYAGGVVTNSPFMDSTGLSKIQNTALASIAGSLIPGAGAGAFSSPGDAFGLGEMVESTFMWNDLPQFSAIDTVSDAGLLARGLYNTVMNNEDSAFGFSDAMQVFGDNTNPMWELLSSFQTGRDPLTGEEIDFDLFEHLASTGVPQLEKMLFMANDATGGRVRQIVDEIPHGDKLTARWDEPRKRTQVYSSQFAQNLVPNTPLSRNSEFRRQIGNIDEMLDKLQKDTVRDWDEERARTG